MNHFLYKIAKKTFAQISKIVITYMEASDALLRRVRGEVSLKLLDSGKSIKIDLEKIFS